MKNSVYSGQLQDTFLAHRKLCWVLRDTAPCTEYLNEASERCGLCWDLGTKDPCEAVDVAITGLFEPRIVFSNPEFLFLPSSFQATLLIYAEGIFPALPPSSWWAFPTSSWNSAPWLNARALESDLQNQRKPWLFSLLCVLGKISDCF